MISASIPFLRTILTVAALAAFGVTVGRTQVDQSGGRTKLLVNEVGLPGIDRGLRAQEPPMEPYGRGTRGLALADRVGQAHPRGDYLRGSVIVKFTNVAGQGGVNSAMRVVSATEIARPSYANFDIIDIPQDADPEAVAATLRARSDVEYAQPRYRNYPMLRPNDPLYSRQWNFPLLDMERAWDIQPDAGRSVTVAVLDTG